MDLGTEDKLQTVECGQELPRAVLIQKITIGITLALAIRWGKSSSREES